MAEIYSEIEDQRAFEGSLSADFRAERQSEAEARIIAGLKETRLEFARRCIETPQAAIVVEGWEAFNERLAQLSIDETSITAAGVDLSNASDELSLECSYYSDRHFPFSTSDRGQILAENEAYGGPWRGGFEQIDGALEIRGLSELYAIVDNSLGRAHALPANTEPADFAAVRLAQWFIFLRFHRALKAELDRHGLVAPIPLLVGENMPGPWLEAVYYPARKFELIVSPRPKRSIEEQKAAAAREMDEDIEYQVNRFVMFRQMFSKETTRSDPAMAGYLRSFGAEEEDWKRRAGLVGYAKSWEQSEAEFEDFVAVYRYARAPGKYPMPPSPPPSMRRGTASGSPLRKLFGKKGL
jgi:hypothetical protein